MKIEKQSPCSYFCTSIHPKIQWNWFTQHFHVPSWWVPSWVSSQNKDQSSIALCHCWGDRERCVLRVWMLWGSWFPLWKPRDLPLRSRTDSLDFPGSAVVKNPPANAGNIGSSPGPGGSHMPQSNKPVHHNYWSPRAWSPCSATRKPVQHNNEDAMQPKIN